MFSILAASPGFAVVNKPHDVAMDDYGQEEGKLTVQGWVLSAQGKAALTAAGALVAEAEKAPEVNENDDDDEQPKKPVHRAVDPNTVDGVLRFVHQLDYATSGILCLAFSKRLSQKLAFAFESRAPRKEYVAIVHGWIVPREFAAAAATDAQQPSSSLHRATPPYLHCAKPLLTPEDEAAVGAMPLEDILSQFPGTIPPRSGDDALLSSCRRLYINCPIGNDPTDKEKAFRMCAVPQQGLPQQRRDREETGATATAGAAAATTTAAEAETAATDSTPNSDAATNAKPAATILTVIANGFLKVPAAQPDSSSSSPARMRVSLVHLQLLSGRRHQLRVHCGAVLGAPIVGDVTYCDPQAHAPDKQPRMMLHAWRLAMPQSAVVAGDARAEQQQHKSRRREIKAVRAAAAAADGAKKGADGAEDVQYVSFCAPEPLSQFFTHESA